MSHTNITSCRSCGGKDLEPLLDLGPQYVNAFPLPGEDHGPRVPIEVVWCPACKLAQQLYTADQRLLYQSGYWYRSGTTDTMRKALAEVVNAAAARVRLDPGDVVLDLGSNDGTLLRAWKAVNQELVTVGVDPGVEFGEPAYRHGVDVFVNDFWGTEGAGYAYRDGVDGRAGEYRAKVVTALGMLYDLVDPNPFVQQIALHLHPGGLFVAQLMCLRNMIRTADVGNLCHEHLEFYTLHSLEVLLNRHGLELYDLECNSVNGESYRLFVRHQRKPGDLAVSNASHALEHARHLEHMQDWPRACRILADRIDRTRNQVHNYLDRERKDGRSCWVLGASTKGNTIVQSLGLTATYVVGASERNPAKWGRQMVGSGIPIHSEDHAREALPDNFLVLPYAFLREITAREEGQRWRTRGGKFVVPLPEFKVL